MPCPAQAAPAGTAPQRRRNRVACAAAVGAAVPTAAQLQLHSCTAVEQTVGQVQERARAHTPSPPVWLEQKFEGPGTSRI